LKLFVDTNVLIPFFWKKSATRNLLSNLGLKLFAPEYALREINKHESDILRKAGLSRKEFAELRKDLCTQFFFVFEEEYKRNLGQALKAPPDPDDADFFAVAMLLELPIWSNDEELKAQKQMAVYSTSDLLELPEFLDALFS